MKSALLAAAAAISLPASATSAQTILYSQPANGPGIVSDETNGAYNAYAADDFVVPAGTKWTIQEVDVAGYYSEGGPAPSEGVIIYKTQKRTGGPAARRAFAASLTCTDNAGSFSCPLSNGPTLRAGHYWLSFFAVCDSSCGQWNWTEDTTVQNLQAMWENPARGYRTSCTKWKILPDCGLGSSADMAFTLIGVSD